MPSTDSGLLRETVRPIGNIEAQPTTQSQPRVERPRSGALWAERVSQELDAVSATLCAAVGETRARLLALVQEEIRRGLEGAIEDARAMLSVPAIGVAAESPLLMDVKRVSDGGASGPPAADGQKASTPSLRVVDETSNDEEAGPSAAEAADLPTPGTNGVGAAPSVASTDGVAGDSAGELSNGTVRLVVEADGSVRRVVQFVDDLCQKPQFRLLRLVGSRRKTGVEIWLGLREPLSVAKALSQMRDVSRVTAANDSDGKENERSFNVWLAQESSAS